MTLSTGKFGKFPYAPVTAHSQQSAASLGKPQSNLRALSPEICRQSFYNLPATCCVSDKSLCKVKKWYWDEMTHFCNRDGWVFKCTCLLLALLVSICGHGSLSTCTSIYGAWPPLTCAEARFISSSLSCSGKHLQVSQDTSLKQLEQLPGLQHPQLVQVAISINVHFLHVIDNFVGYSSPKWLGSILKVFSNFNDSVKSSPAPALSVMSAESLK